MKDRTYTLSNLTRDDLVILSDAMEVYLDDLNTALHFEEDAQEREASLTWVRGPKRFVVSWRRSCNKCTRTLSRKPK